MSVDKRLLKELFALLLSTLAAIIGWIIIAPITFLIPKNKKRIVVIGRDGGKLLDNSKYFYIQVQALIAKDVQCTFVTEHSSVYQLLKQQQLPALLYPSVKSIFYLATAKVVIVDSVDWQRRMRLFLTAGSKRIQLWHGVGFKRIELDKLNNEATSKRLMSSKWMLQLRLLLRFFTGRNAAYSLVNTTSKFYLEQVFEPAFTSRYFAALGYPRNALDGNPLYLLNTDSHIFTELKKWLTDNKKIILVSPTFRDTRETPMGIDAHTLEKINHWCEANNAVFVFKFHPCERGTDRVQSEYIYQYQADKDIYPLFPYAYAMVSDYSSIYMDFLLLDKPVYFLVPDLEEYIAKDRQIQFDFNRMTPGPKVNNWDELLQAILLEDAYKQEREKLRTLAYDNLQQADSTKKILQSCKNMQWIN